MAMNEYFVSRKVCPCCGSTDSSEICRACYTESPLRDYLDSFYSPQGKAEFEYLVEQDYILVECRKCGLIYQKEIPNDFLMEKLYEVWIDSVKTFGLFEKNRGIDYFSHLCSEIIRVVTYFDVPPSQLDFLDFSMGWGNWCRVAQSFGCKVQGTEFSPARIEYAKKTGIKVISYNEIREFKYDFINTEQVFEHLPKPQETLSHLKSSLKQHGILKISVPNGWNVKERLRKWDWEAPKGSPDSLNPVAPLEHVNCFNHDALVVFARNAGLVPIDIPATSLRSPAPTDSKKEVIKSILRPYYHRFKGLIRRTPYPPKSTYLMFRALH